MATPCFNMKLKSNTSEITSLLLLLVVVDGTRKEITMLVNHGNPKEHSTLHALTFNNIRTIPFHYFMYKFTEGT
ncbi:hypothetical protein HanXRQr2_Chr02g0066151 [Helianthus annuus]|uniref:Uncharacterized protein n=1 Tax=Helianthus annuus TaxID=4232 RepID=A0A9K3DKT3_HELAN|nr:hypothetical protein HanXRQr2_Chr17g0809561 [Helianthus annuus]KAF5818513.1 hypothetical protein HanXRQr2_Chr02g0066151 [Helianthus annuus]